MAGRARRHPSNAPMSALHGVVHRGRVRRRHGRVGLPGDRGSRAERCARRRQPLLAVEAQVHHRQLDPGLRPL